MLDMASTVTSKEPMRAAPSASNISEKQGSEPASEEPPKENICSVSDPNIVTWDGPDDPENPKNWSLGKKWIITTLVSCFTFITPISSSMVAPALATIAYDLRITDHIQSQMVLSIFVLAFVIGPFLLGPLSEIYGRVRVLQIANVMFLVFNTACGAAKSTTQMLIFRFLSGIGGSAPLSVAGGTLSDMFTSKDRGKAIAVYSLAPVLGPSVGAVISGVMVQRTSWHWLFYTVSLADVAVQLLGIFSLKETYAPTLLSRKKARLIQETGNIMLYTEYDSKNKSFHEILSNALVRPFRLLGTQVIIQILAVYQAYLYGVSFLLLADFPNVWRNIYHESIEVGSFNYFSFTVGFAVASQIAARINDKIYIKLASNINGEDKPEFRVPLAIMSSFFVPLGLFLYGWSAQEHWHWVVPNIGVAIFSGAGLIVTQCLTAYTVDSYPRYTASALASVSTMKNLAGFTFPLFAPYMYETLKYGWGNSLLAFVTIVIGVPGPFILWKYGEKLRMRSRYAAGENPL